MPFGIFIIGNLPDTVSLDASGDRILYLGNSALDGSLNVACILKAAVADRVERTIFQHNAVRIAQRLLAADVASHEFHVM